MVTQCVRLDEERSLRVKHIYYICSHFTYLTIYVGMCSFCRKYLPEVRQHLVLVEYPFFSLVDHEDLLEGYDSIHRVTYCESALTNHWRSELRPRAIYGRLAKVWTFLKDARKFTFEESSLCFVSGVTETALGVRLLMSKIRRETRHSVICRVGTSYHKSDECKTNDWISWLENNVYVLLGAPPVAVKFYGWMMAERRFYYPKKVIDHHLVFSNRWSKNQDFLEVKYPLLDDVRVASLKKQCVLFLDRGTGWLSLFPEMSREQYIATTNQVLRALTDLYKNEDVALLFKPHPRQEEIPYDLAGFDVYSKNILAEMMFLRDRKAIRAVYSVVSSTVRTADLFGINAYVLSELYNLPEELRIRNQKSVLDFSDVVSIRNLDELRLPEPRSNRSLSTTDQDLERLAQLFRELTS